MNIELQSMALDLPPVEGHPNRLPFRGVLTVLDSPSDRPPSGARGRRVLLTRAAAEAALPSLLGMGLDYSASLDRHEPRRKVGIITEAEVQSRVASRQSPADAQVTTSLTVGGYLFASDFPDVVRELRAAGHLLGMSYEITDVRVEDLRAPIWRVTAFTFTGAAVLRRDKAAYRSTWIEIAAHHGSTFSEHAAPQAISN